MYKYYPNHINKLYFLRDQKLHVGIVAIIYEPKLKLIVLHHKRDSTSLSDSVW